MQADVPVQAPEARPLVSAMVLPVSRVPVVLAGAVIAVLLASCEEPAMLTVSVHRSVLLGDYANPPLWEWSASAPRVAAVEVSLDGGPYRRLDPYATSYRPPRPLAPGRHTLTVRARTSGVAGFDLQESDTAVVAALPGRPPVPGDPCYPAGAAAVGCGGSSNGQWPLRRMRLPEVWQALAAHVLPEPEPVVVAVLDTGYVPHPDLLPNLDTAAGYDFIRDPEAAADGDGIDPDATDPATGGPWHGTAMAGVIAAQTDNGTGLAGMGWPWGRSRVAIMPVRVVAPRGATSYDVAQGLLYAAGLQNDSGRVPRRPAEIINLSFADSLPGPPDELLEDVLRRVTEAGAIVVSAAGNHGSAVRAPANSRYTLAVAAAGMDGSLAPTSNSGPETDVIAPGGDSRAGVPTLGAGSPGAVPWMVTVDHGTSIAAAHVSGVLALLAGVAPSLTLSDVRSMLARAGDGLPGAGLLDAFGLFGSYPAASHGLHLRSDGRFRDPGATSRGASASGIDPQSVIVRFRDGDRAGGGYSLLRLDDGEDRELVKARLRDDPGVASVHDNRIYVPAGVPAE